MTDPAEHPPVPSNATGQPPSAVNPVVPRKRRWLRRVVILLIVLAVGAAALVGMAPSIASTGWVRSRVLTGVSADLRGAVDVESWSLSWFSECSVRGLRVRDPDDREVLHIESVELRSGLWHALTTMEQPGDVIVTAPKVTLIVAPDGSVSLADAFASRNPQSAAPAGEPLKLRTSIDVKGGAADVVFADGRRAGVEDIAAHVELATAGGLKAKVAAAVAKGGRLSADVDLQDWMKEGAFNVGGATGTVRLATDEAVDLAEVDRVAALGAGLGGAVKLVLEGTLTAGRLDGRYSVEAKGLQAAATAQSVVTPLDGDARGHVVLAGDALAADMAVRGDWGTLNNKLTCRLSTLAGGQWDPNIVAAWLAGEKRSVALPELTLESSGKVDLAALGKAIPAVLRVRAGTQITAGTLTLEHATLQGGDEPSLTLGAELTELRARSSERDMRCAPIAARFAVTNSAARGLVISDAQVTSGFGTLSAEGTPGDITAEVSADLAELRSQLGGIFELPVDELAGQLTAKLAVQRGADNAIAYDLSASATDLRYAADGRRLVLARGSTTQRGSFSLPKDGGRPERMNGAFTVELTQVQAAAGGQAAVQAMDLTLAGKADLKGDDANVEVDASGDWGKLSAVAAGRLAGLSEVKVADDLVTALLAGERVQMTLPEARIDVQGRIDVAVLGRAVPALVHVRPGVEITGGTVELASFALRGGQEPSLKMAAEVRGLAARTPQRLVECQPITMKVDAAATRARGVEIRRADITTGFGAVTASGSAGDVTATLKADLAELQAQWAGIFELPVDELAGTVTASLSAKRIEGDKVAMKVKADGAKVHYVSGARRFDVATARAQHTGTATLQGGKVARIDATETTLALDDGVQVQAKGWYALNDPTFSASVTLRQADLAYVARLAAAGGVENIQAMTGVVRGELQVGRAEAGGPVRSDGKLTAQDLTVDGQAVVGSGTCRWQELALAAEAGTVQATAVEVQSEPLQFTASKLQARLGAEPEASGDLQLASDLHLLTTLLAGLGLLDTQAGIAGTLTADGKMRTGGGHIDVSGKADIANFVVEGQAAATPQSAKFNYDAQVDTQKQSVALRTFKLESPLASVNLKGTVGYAERARTVKLAGDYRMVWADVLPILYALAPELRDQFELTGVSADQVQVSGTLATAESTSPLAGLTAQSGVGWDSAMVLGVELGKTKLAPTLAKGVITLPVGPIPAASGTVRVGGAVDLTQSPPMLRMPGETKVLEKVQVTPELARGLLSRFNPIFSNATQLQGTADLMVRDLELPLGANISAGGAGGGTLTLDNFQIAPGGFLSELLTLGKLTGEMYIVEVSGLEFEVHDGRIHYRDLTLRFVEDKFDLKFYGSVGFDDTLDLTVSIPIGEKVLEQVGMRTGTAEYARLLAGLRVDVPVAGTRENPKLNFAQVNMKSLMDQAVRKQGEDLLTGGGLIDLIGGLSGKKGNRGKTGDRAPEVAPGSTPAPAPSATPAPAVPPTPSPAGEADKSQPESKKSGVKVGRKGTPKKSPRQP